MVRRECVVNKLREKGFSFKKSGDRVELYKKKGSTEYASVRRRDFIEEAEARTALQIAGCTTEEVAAFLAQYNSKLN